jgi:hypothetical protein
MTPPRDDDVWGDVESDIFGDRSVAMLPPRTPPAPTAPSIDRGPTVAGILLIALLAGVCVALVYENGAYGPRSWLPAVIGVAALAIVATIAGPALWSERFQKILVALFGLQALWTAASIIWATSQANAWEETNRTFLYAVAVALSFVAVRWARRLGLRILALLIAAIAAIVAFETAIGLAVSEDLSRLFVVGRLNYPIGYFNALACFWMIGFWLSMGMANAPGYEPESTLANRFVASRRTPAGRVSAPIVEHSPYWAQPVLLSVAVFLAEMALLPESRGALWTFFLVIPFFVILSPNRFRALIDLGIVVLPVVLFWHRFTGVYVAARASDSALLRPALDRALEGMGYSICIVVGAWAVSWLVERLLAPLSRRTVKWVAVVLVVLFVIGVVGGLVYADHRTGGLGGYLDDRWHEVVADQGTGAATDSRFAMLGLNGRWTQWKTAAEAFREHPVLGIGAQNFEIYNYEHRVVPIQVKQPHSQIMQLLSELGFPGLLLYLAFVIGTLVYAARLRFRRIGRPAQATIAAVMTATICWFIHSSADWLWQMTATTLPAMMLLGGLVGSGDAAGPAGMPAVPVSGRRPRLAGLTRPVVVVLALAVIVSATLPYMALRYSDLAVSAKTTDRMIALTNTAAKIDPTSAQPFTVRAYAYRVNAQGLSEGSPEQFAGFQDEIAAWSLAIEREPGYWLYYYEAAKASIAARDAALMSAPQLADTLTEEAHAYLAEAKRLNPLSKEVEKLEKGLEE